MRPDGGEQEQVTSDDTRTGFRIHRRTAIGWSSCPTRRTSRVPENKDVMLRLLSLADKRVTVLATLFGGQGTINVPSWSPDSRRLAFVSYLLLPQ